MLRQSILDRHCPPLQQYVQSTEQLHVAIEMRNIMLKRFIFNMLYRLALRDGSGLDEFRCLSDLVAE